MDSSYVQYLMDKYGVAWFKFDESSGNVTDSKGSAIGTITGATRVAGFSGNALSFDGVDDYVLFNNPAIPTGKKSIRFKFKSDSSKLGSVQTLISTGAPNDNRIFIALDSNGYLLVSVNKGDTNILALRTNSNLLNNQWHDVLFTWDGTTNTNGAKLYVDNMNSPLIQGEMADLEATTYAKNLILGGSYNTETTYMEYFKGQLDELEIYNEVIEPTVNKILILSNDNKVKSLEYINNNTPIMTSNTLPYGEVKSSTSYLSRYPYTAFDGQIGSWNSGWLSNGTTNQWISYSYPYLVDISKYAIWSVKDNRMPKEFRFEVSNDGVNWTVIDQRIMTLNDWENGDWNYFNLDKTVKAKYFRLYCVNNNGGANYIAIPEIKLIGEYNHLIELPSISEQNFINYGMDKGEEIDLSQVFTKKTIIHEDGTSETIETDPFTLADELGSSFQVIEYTGNPTQETSVITAETDPYSVYDYISETPEVLVYTELDEDITVETTTEPFDLYDEFGDSVDVLYYTDDESVNEADLILEANWSPLDELEGDFEVVVWTEEPSDIAQRALKMTAIPNPQFIKLVNPLKLYGYLEDVLIDDISQTYKNKKETRYLITDENSNDWYVFDKNTREFKIVDASTHESIIENGMTFEDLNSIEEEDWKKWGKEWLNIGIFLKDNERDTIVSVIDNMSYKDFLPRDTSSLSETSLYILNTTARIDISINGNTIKGVLSDDDLTRVQYRVLLNGEHYYPEDGSFTDLSEPPQNIGITFTSKDIKVDELNTVRVEFRDFFGTIDYWEADFIGTYSGLVFKDIYGDYFSTEIGEVLKYLDFGVIVAGQVTVEHEIILKNQYGYDVKNIQLFANTSEFPDGMTIEFSDSLAPFNPQEKLIIPEVLENGEELSFYVRLRTTLGVTPNANGSFDIIVKADRV